MAQPIDSEFLADDEQFLDELLTTAGFNPEEDDFDFLKKDLRPLLSERITLKLYEALPTEGGRAEFDTMMTADEEVAPEILYAFFIARIPHFDDFMANIYLEFQNEYLEAMKQ
ncbi:MAG: hypothetical protein LBI53_01490 [Candidatus Peribacteria bacterium]|jgi:hypothetical protein|nr:hypothetical protein [Candidatus Peribacteria bacterium]